MALLQKVEVSTHCSSLLLWSFTSPLDRAVLTALVPEPTIVLRATSEPSAAPTTVTPWAFGSLSVVILLPTTLPLESRM